MEFKVGDKIVVSKDNTSNRDSYPTGTKGVIKEIDSSITPYFVDFDDGENGWVNKVELAKEYKPRVTKTPSHLVVWEENTDPCKFFNSLEEANEFVKKLSENTNVKEDSIILVEIKSARKITIQKSLRKSEYKI